MNPISIRRSQAAIARFAEQSNKALSRTISILENEFEKASCSVDVVSGIPVQLELERLYQLRDEQVRIASKLRESLEFVCAATEVAES